MVTIQTVGKIKKVDFVNYETYKKETEKNIALDFDLFEKIFNNIYGENKDEFGQENPNLIYLKIKDLINVFQKNNLELVLFSKKYNETDLKDKRINLALKINSIDSDDLNSFFRIMPFYENKPPCKYFISEYNFEYRKNENPEIKLIKLFYALMKQDLRYETIIGIDFDNVLNLDEKTLDKNKFIPNPEMFNFLKYLQNINIDSKIVIDIITMRAYRNEYKKDVLEWLNEQGIKNIRSVTTSIDKNIKLFIDDNCMCCKSYNELIELIPILKDRTNWRTKNE